MLSLDYDRELVDSDEESRPQMKLPTLAKSPRRPSIEQKYEEEVIKLKRMTNEEKHMVKALIKLTTRKVITLSPTSVLLVTFKFFFPRILNLD